MTSKTMSFLRRAEYERLAQLSIDGTILDIGGSKKSGYHELIGGMHEIVTGNIESSYGIDIIFDAERIWPCHGQSLDGVLFVNVLEHLYRPRAALIEASRVMRPGAIVAGVVPFMFNIHTSPNDYYRYTRFALEQMLREQGFTAIMVEELGTGAFSVIYQCLIAIIRWNWLANLLIPLVDGIDRLISVIKPGNFMSARFMPLGYYFEAKRPSRDLP